MAEPNYIKSIAPDVAKAIRAAVNPNHRLRRIIQFNAVPLAAGDVSSEEDLGGGLPPASNGDRL